MIIAQVRLVGANRMFSLPVHRSPTILGTIRPTMQTLFSTRDGSLVV